jgi:hypothetical protein
MVLFLVTKFVKYILSKFGVYLCALNDLFVLANTPVIQFWKQAKTSSNHVCIISKDTKERVYSCGEH